MANTALGVLRGIGSLTDKAVTALGDRQKKSELLKSPITKEILTSSIYKQILTVHRAVLNVLQAKGIVSERDFEFVRTIDTPSGILENIKRGRISEDKIANSLIKAIQANPYLQDAYRLWFHYYGDSTGELATIANYFGVVNVDILKDDLIGKKVSALDYSTSETFKNGLAEIETEAARIGFSGIEDLASRLRNTAMRRKEDELDFSNADVYERNIALLEQYAENIGYTKFGATLSRLYKLRKTYKGVVYETEGERSAAQKEDEELAARTADGKVYETIAEADKAESTKHLDVLLGGVIFLTGWPALFVFANPYTKNSRVYASLLAAPITLLALIAILGAGSGSRRSTGRLPVLAAGVQYCFAGCAAV